MMNRNCICRRADPLKKGREIGQYGLCVEGGGDVEEDEAAEWVQARTFWVRYFSHPLFFSQLNKESF